MNSINLYLYFIPLVLCLIGYSFRTIDDYKRDSLRDFPLQHYVNKLTWGTIIFRLVISLLPVINILALIVDLSSTMLQKIYNRVCTILDKPIVKGR